MNADMNAWPWAQPVWERTAGALDTLHHALLITGVPGIAKREFAMTLSRLLLCGNPAEQKPCGACQNCALFAAATHPDFHVLTTELEARDGRIALLAEYCNRYQDIGAREKRAQPSRVIPVDQVRLLIERFCAHAHTAARKIALILPADRMNINAANALLKLLEEPPDNSVLILVSALPGYLPATIRSRCLQIKIPPPDEQTARAWLLAHIPKTDAPPATGTPIQGGPLDALQILSDGFAQDQDALRQDIAHLAAGKISALELAGKLKQHDFLRILDWLHRISDDLIKASCGIATPTTMPTPPSPEKMFALYDKIGYYRKIARDQINEQLALEELALALQGALRPASRT